MYGLRENHPFRAFELIGINLSLQAIRGYVTAGDATQFAGLAQGVSYIIAAPTAHACNLKSLA